MRNLLILLVAAMGVGLDCAAGLAQPGPDAARLTPEQFAILPWGETPGTPEALQTVYDCGFNLAGFVKPEFLDLVSAAQLKCIVIDKDQHPCEPEFPMDEPAIRRHVEALFQRVGGHKAVFGYYVFDEPCVQFYPELQLWVDSYRRVAPQAIAYINIFANLATSRQMGVATYAQYVESYVQTVRPSFLSYDHYALMADGSVRNGYFQNLEVIRTAALRYNLPFWNTVLANAHYTYAAPTDAGLRFQLYTTLAYGARGISYFTYFTPNIGNYRLGPIDQFGRKTPTWDMLRNVNMQLHRIGPVFTKLRSIGAFHYPNAPEGCIGLDQSRWIDSLDGGNLMVGEFEGPEGEPFVLVVNKSLQDSVPLELRFKEPGRIQFVSAYTGQLLNWAPDNHWLAPGQGLLLCLKRP